MMVRKPRRPTHEDEPEEPAPEPVIEPTYDPEPAPEPTPEPVPEPQEAPVPQPAPTPQAPPQLRVVQPMPLDNWPIPGDVPDVRAIVQDQATTIAAQEALLHAYQGNLNTAQNPLPGAAATGPATTTGASTSIVVASVTGTIAMGATVTNGSLVPPGTKVLGIITGAMGGPGTYLISAPINLATATTLTFTPPPPPSTWPIPNDADTLMTIQQTQTAILRTQSALLSHYQDLLNQSQVPSPPTGP